jgi:large subunit ribosomal protein L10
MAGLTKNFARKKPASRKQDVVTEFGQALSQSTVAVLVQCPGLNTAQLSTMRKKLRVAGATLNVVKNTLAQRAVEAHGQPEGLKNLFTGPVSVLLGSGDQVEPVKAYAQAMKDMKKDVVFSGGLLDGQLLDAAGVEQLVNLPPLIELRGKLLGGIASPVTGLVAAISGPQRALVNVLDQLAQQKQAAGA